MQKRQLLLILAFLAAAPAVWAAPGVIQGRVVDGGDRFSLAGANVYIESLGIGTTSGQNGTFELVNVPDGSHEVTVAYLGYGTVTRSVQVRSGEVETILIELESGVVVGDEVLVLGERLKGQARALNQQRSSITISNIVSSDQIGKFPDSNIGDALKRVPAITVNYDQGEARFANLRGTEPRLNSVMINGERVPSAEGEIRAVQLDLIPADAIASIEVTKAVTPDMEADAIGGAVNLITRAAPNGLRVSATAGGGYNLLREEPNYTGAFVLGQRFAENRLGVVVSGSLFDNTLGSDNTEGEWDVSDDGQIFANEWEARRYDITRVRRSLSGALDYRLTPTSTLYLRGIYNHRDDLENRYRVTWDLGDPADNGVVQEAAVILQTKAGIDNDEVDNRRLEEQITYSTSLAGDHLFGNIRVDWLAGYAKASEERPNERYIEWEVEDVPVRVDISDPEEPRFAPVDDIALGAYELAELTEENQYTEEEDLTVRLDIEVPVIADGDYRNAIKFGGRFKGKDKERDNNFFEFEPVDGSLASLAESGTANFTDEDFAAGDYRIGTLTTGEFLGGLNLDDASRFEKVSKPDEFAPDNYTASEDVIAGYAMLKQDIGDQWKVIAGVRVEQTTIDYVGNAFNEDTEAVTAVPGEDDYVNVLPGLHVNYRHTPNTVFRFAWTNTLARPNYYQLVPFRNIIPEDEEVEAGNPALEPTTSMNLDFMAEHYFESVGILSAGVFYKSINDFIYIDAEGTTLVDGAEFDLIQPKNGAEASLFGLEFAAQRQLDFLPGIGRNFGIYGNYTWTSSEAESPEFEETIDLPGTAEHTLNAALTFQTRQLALSLSFNYTSAYLDPDDLDLTPGLERYYDEVTYLDLSGSYAITPQLRVYFDANNLLNQPLRYYAGDSNRTYQAEYYKARISGGLKFDL